MLASFVVLLVELDIIVLIAAAVCGSQLALGSRLDSLAILLVVARSSRLMRLLLLACRSAGAAVSHDARLASVDNFDQRRTVDHLLLAGLAERYRKRILLLSLSQHLELIHETQSILLTFVARRLSVRRIIESRPILLPSTLLLLVAFRGSIWRVRLSDKLLFLAGQNAADFGLKLCILCR